MKTYLAVSFAMLTGVAIGGFAVQGLHAQGKKAYTVTELQVLDAKTCSRSCYQSLRRHKQLRAARTSKLRRQNHGDGRHSTRTCGNYRVADPWESGGLLQVKGLDRSRTGNVKRR
jgi:hypothetical protein